MTVQRMEMSKPSPSAFERRAFGRRATDILAKVRIGYRIEPCKIRDISEGGALLEFTELPDLPQRLWLSWPDYPQEIMCELRHVRANRAGVQFARPISVSIRQTTEPQAPAAAGRRTADADAEPAAARDNGAALVAQLRAGLRLGAGDVPRDASGILTSVRAELERRAQEVVLARAVARVPRPCAAICFAGAAIEPPEISWESRKVPAPSPASGLASLRQHSPREVVPPACVPRPLAACSMSRVVSEPAAAPPVCDVPLPLPASCYAVRDAIRVASAI